MGNLVRSSELNSVSLKALFRLPFSGNGWPAKLLIGIVIGFSAFIFPIVPWLFTAGYGIRVMRVTIEGRPPELPDWDEWGQMAWDGLRALAISLIFFLPGLIVLFGGMGLYFLSAFALPITTVAAERGDFSPIFLLFYFLGFGILFISMGLGNFLIFLASIPLPAVLGHFAATNKFSSIIQVGIWFRVLWRNLLGYFITWVIALGIFGILYLLFFFGYFLIFPLFFMPILAPVLGFIIGLILQALFGQTYREGILMVD